ncbi:MAG: glycerol uptake facilitator, MIP channel [Candidatus Methanoperedens nitroreducens]|uniref:Glycerol uptake facilitator, MIP channel n=2 Tax=Candidatus Methanoperedens TaxID=1392997 RepID=A0A0P8CGB5_9EURY|nr:MAG: MIP family channel protein [Candidatus Methanoperedens sp.]KPQ41728.1 MAG: glycerol uptake facilitator, MIP channel [Candidatus Methanoperedens sp. BLZ1]CAG0952761.1 Aquaporin Z [Methanosarcinales archaeon]
MTMFRKIAAEFIGTFALVFAGTGAIIDDSLTGKIGQIGIAMSFGLVVAVMIYSLGHISKAHFNPAVTIGFASVGKFEKKHVLPYIAAQIGGAILASALLFMIFGNIGNLGATLPRGSWMQSFILEVVMTFFLMLVIISVATDSRVKPEISGIAIGGVVALDALFGGAISGASMNPARSLGPAIIGGIFDNQWIYLIAPVIGSLIAVVIYEYIRTEKKIAGG